MIIQIVDENDELIGCKDRDLIKPEDIYRVSALWIKNSKGKSLLARKSYDKKMDPGKWGPAVAGTLEKGETYESNIIKETEEEIGLDLTKIKFEISSKVRRKFEGIKNYFCQWYKAVVDKEINKFKIDKNEVAEIKWFSRHEFLKRFKENPDEFLPSMKYHKEWF